MPKPTIYLDDARIGRFRPEAKRLYQAFIDFAANCPTSQHVMDLLEDGDSDFHSLQDDRQPEAIRWKGVDAFRKLIATSFSNVDASNVFIASRTKSLMQIGASAISRLARNTLCVDLNWDGYQRTLTETIHSGGGCVIGVRLRDAILHRGWDCKQVCDAIVSAYARNRCDSMFLPAVDSFGIRLPIRAIVEEIRQRCDLRFVLVDAAQAFGHVDVSELSGVADFVIGGTHKWLGSYLPLGIGVACNPNTQRLLSNSISGWLRSLLCDDNLMRFLASLSDNSLKEGPETVNLSPIFSGFGAWAAMPQLANSIAIRSMNVDTVIQVGEEFGWEPVRPMEEFQTGSLLLRRSQHLLQSEQPFEPSCLEREFAQSGIQLSCVADGIVRLAMPEQLFSDLQIEQIESGFCNVSRALRAEQAVETFAIL